MADQAGWTIGAAAECDVVVDEPTVSGRHCRLTRSGDGFLLEDLGSTNGTFVNGTRLTAPLSVSPADEIKLGPGTVFSWETIQPAAPTSRIIRIGRLPDNDVVLDFTNVSGYHARIVIENGQTSIEDLGSTNGVAIGNPDNKITNAALGETDTVYFGSMPVPAVDLLNPGRMPSPARSDAGATPVGKWGGPQKSIAIVAVSVVALAVIVGGAAALFQGNGSDANSPSTDDSSDDSVAGSADSTSGSSTSDAAPKIAASPDRAVYSVLMQDARTGVFLSIGTAWAISENRLVTSAGIATVIQLGRADYPQVKVRCESLDREFVVDRFLVHPSFQKAYADDRQAARKADDLRTRIDESAESPDKTGLTKEELEKLIQQLIDLEEERFQAIERQIFFDVAVVEVKDRLPEILTADFSGTVPQPTSEANAFGLAYPADDLQFYADAPDPVTADRLQGRIRQIVRLAGQSRLMIECPADHHTRNWTGSPILNSAGEVIAVYSRPTPPVDPRKPPPGDSFDAALIKRLLDFAPDLK